MRKITRCNEQLEELALDASFKHGICDELHHKVLAHSGRSMKRHDKRLLLTVQIKVALERVHNRVLDKRLSEQVLVQIVVESGKVVAQVRLRAALVQSAFHVLKYIKA